jgi:hypothetical protein
VAAFVRASAILVGMANVLCLGAIGLWLAATGAEELEGLNGYHALLGLSVAVAAGLVAAEVVLRFARRALRGRFLSRYVAMVLGMCLGGALTVLIPALLIATPVGIANAEPFGNILLFVGVFTAYGGLAGMIEGLILALPLAAFLERFGTAG